MISLKNGSRVIVWEEAVVPERTQAAVVSSAHQHGPKHVQASTASKIMLRLEGENQSIKTIPLAGAEEGRPTHPVVASVDQRKVLVAWTQEGKESSGIWYTTIDLLPFSSH